MKCWEVIAPGLLTTVQDLGREGWRHLGVARTGAMDPRAADLANRLLGNDAGAAVLEMTVQGPTFHLSHSTRIAITGAEATATWNGMPLPGWRPIVVPAGELRFSGLREGIRAWLAVEGGFDVPLLMGSRSTDLRGGFGGVDGRALRAGDRVPVGACDAVFSGDSGADQAVAAPRIAGWWVGRDDHRLGTAGPVRFVASLHPLSAGLSGRKWQVSAHSNRQGIRLQGEPLADAGHHGWSEPVAIGTIQLPPDGQPIVLMADAQTVGGYARLGHVIAADMPRLAQAGAGTTLVFEQVGMDEARGISRQQRQQHARTCIAIGQRLG